MYWLDTAILAVLLLGAAFGALSGLLWQVARLVGFVITFYAAILPNDPAASFLKASFMQDAEPWACRLVAYILVFLLIYLIILLLTFLLERALRASRLQTMNRVLGALLGAVKAGLIL